MTENEKELLWKDLCARLPYGVEVEYDNCTCEVRSIDRFHEELTILKFLGYSEFDVKIEDIKPYLFPLSSMTEEQLEEFEKCGLEGYHDYDWYNKNHFDYRGLIPMGLAKDATGLNIY